MNLLRSYHQIFAITIIALTITSCTSEKINSETLYKKHSTHNFSFAEKDSSSQLLLLAQEQCQQGNFTQGLSHLENYLAEHTNAPYALLAKGVVLVRQGEHRKAKTMFKILIESGSGYEDEALWETAMVYLKQGFPQAGIYNLQQVSPEFNRYKEAQELMKKLRVLLNEKN
ncbi:MAG: hypothetical protein DHS20C18_07130 [Saprospiraceae bacterium]|nr:MAG: hypothetical protein DHS20C18_07130 [Saprospiraceae bacterium]